MPIYKIFGIGLGRTGTKSLADAMRILGYTSKHGGTLWDVKKFEFLADIAIAARWRFLDYYFGQTAKFILTIRDKESWIESTRRHAQTKGGRRGKEGVIVGTNAIRAENRFLIYGITHFDKEIFEEAYYKFNNEIIKYFAEYKDRFLTLDICEGEGWGKLCPFLGKSIPLKDGVWVPFPHSHKGQYINGNI